jgi:hypothetical protein
MALLFVSSVSLLWDSLRSYEVNVPGMLFAILTYLPLIMIFAERLNKPIDDRLFGRFVKIACWFVIIQSLIGFVQFAISGNPDAVCGTFGLFDFLEGGITITQVFFTFTMFGMILLLFIAPLNRLSLFAILIGLLTCALAQSGHQTMFFITSLAVLGLTRITRPMSVLISASVVAVAFAATMIAYPRTLEHTREWFDKVVYSSQSPKRMAIEGGLTTLADAKNLVLGTGLGQYSSRAALISSNKYLTIQLPAILSGVSSYHSRFIVPANAFFREVGEGSAISKPYFSLLSLFVELGLVQFAVLAGIIAVAFFQNLRLMRSRLRTVARVGFVANVGIVFFLLCCTIENYAEFPQATFIPFLLYVTAVSKAKTDLAHLRSKSLSGN